MLLVNFGLQHKPALLCSAFCSPACFLPCRRSRLKLCFLSPFLCVMFVGSGQAVHLAPLKSLRIRSFLYSAELWFARITFLTDNVIFCPICKRNSIKHLFPLPFFPLLRASLTLISWVVAVQDLSGTNVPACTIFLSWTLIFNPALLFLISQQDRLCLSHPGCSADNSSVVDLNSSGIKL